MTYYQVSIFTIKFVVDFIGPTLYKCYTDVLCLLGKFVPLQTSRGVLTSQDTVTQMSADLQSLDLTRICQQAAFADSTITSRTLRTMIACTWQ